MSWNAFTDWILSLGVQYGIDPFIFAVIYVGAIPLSALSVAWLIHRIRNKQSIALPVAAASCFMVSTYLYILVAGRNIPMWVYAILTALLLTAVVSTFVHVRRETTRT